MVKSFCNKERCRIIDLSVPVEPHWRYPIEIRDVKSFRDGDSLNIREFNMRTHWYTHIDSPLHYVDGGKSLDDFPLLDMLVGKATVLDISKIGPNEEISPELLEAAAAGQPINDIILISTEWGKKRDWNTREFWLDAPYFSADGAKYLCELGPKVVGFDFPQDYDIRRMAEMKEKDIDFTTHEYILKNEILMVEYLTNLWELPKGSEVDLVILPINIPKADGSQVRAIAII